MADTPKPGEKRRVQVRIDERVSPGVYSNMAMIHHNDAEFVLDFLYAQPQEPSATVRARVITSPRHVKRLIRVLQEQLDHYEKVHGEVQIGKAPEPTEYH